MKNLDAERQIVTTLNEGGLEEFARQFPVPIGEHTYVSSLDGVEYTDEALVRALEQLADDVIIKLIQTEAVVFNHNNISGHGSAGGDLDIDRIFMHAASSNFRKRLKKLIR